MKYIEKDLIFWIGLAYCASLTTTIVLKIVGIIDWSWWWVSSIFYIPMIIGAITVGIGYYIIIKNIDIFRIKTKTTL